MRENRSASHIGSDEAALIIRVAVCVCTYRRKDELSNLLHRLAELTFLHNAVPDMEVVVIDNDAAGSARRICEEIAPSYRWRFRYLIEPAAGISHARNAALRATQDNSDVIIFIDDDEEPVPCWLDELLRVWRATGADAVIGPVEPRFPDNAPAWLVKGGFFLLPRHADEAHLEDGITGNALLDISALRALKLKFNEALAFSGGEDQFFFRQLSSQGGMIRYAAKAICYESVTASRLDYRYVLRRQFRKGNSLALCDRMIAGSPTKLAIRWAKGILRVVGGLILAPPLCLLGGRIGLLRAGAISARGMGMLAELLGYRYLEYRRASNAKGR